MRFCRRLRSDSIGRGAVAAHDRRRAVRSAVDPLRKLLHLKETQRIVATRHVNVDCVEIDGPLLDEEAGDQRDDVAGLKIEIPSFDDWKPGLQRFALYLRQPVDGAPRGANVGGSVLSRSRRRGIAGFALKVNRRIQENA